MKIKIGRNELSKKKWLVVIKLLTGFSIGEGLDEKAFGICWNLDQATWFLDDKFRGYALVSDLSQSWELTTGSAAFPISSHSDEFYRGKWVGKQMELRQSLCMHMVREIEKAIK